MSHKCRLRSYKSIGDDGKWAADRIEQLEAELANIKEIEFPKRVEKVAEGWRGKCETLEAENEKLSLYKNLADEYGLSVFADLSELQKQQRDELLDASEQVLRNKRGEDGWLILSIDRVNLEAAIASVKGAA